MPSHKLAHINITELEVFGYSVAGEETVVAMPQLDVCFDIGKAPDQIVPINNVLLTHGHMDHSAGIAYYLSHRQFCGLPAGTVFVPENLTGPIKDILEGWGRLDGQRIPANLIGVKAGEEYKLKPNLVMKVFPTKHTRGSVGYTVIERRKKLKEEYLGLPGPEIVKLKKQGVEIEYILDIPIVTYLGDTQYVDFGQLDYIANSKILIAECTFFVAEHTERAEAGRHMHIDEFVGLIEKMNNEYIVITHLTQRTSVGEIKKILQQTMKPECFKKVTLLMDNALS